MRGTLDREGVRSLVTPHSPGLDTLLAPLDPGEAERIPTALVSEVLHELRQSYDFVVVDTPPDFKDCVLAALDVSDVYVLLATLDVPSLKNLRLTLDMLDLLGYRRDNWQIVLNRADSKVGLNATDVEKTLKVPDRGPRPVERSRLHVDQQGRAAHARSAQPPVQLRLARVRRREDPAATGGRRGHRRGTQRKHC
jgi:pilus assembly protein CpaE